jgi:hypothetical protein
MQARLPIAFTAAAALLTASSALAASHQLKQTYKSGAERPSSVEIENLVGAARVVAAKGSELVIEYTVVGGGADDAAARALAERVKLETKVSGKQLELRFRYPTDEYRVFIYDGLRSGSDTNTDYLGQRVRVTGPGARDGVEQHVDLLIQLPTGMALELEHAAGSLAAEGAQSDVELGVGAGDVRAQDGQGRFEADTGSGDVSVLNQRGAVSVDTGSGQVAVERVEGTIEVDTGSGDVSIKGSRGASFDVDTGSGSITVQDSSASLDMDTGSGNITAQGLVAGKLMHFDTGSGGVSVRGDLSALRDVDIDAASGGVVLETSTPLDLSLQIESSSGDIQVELPEMRDVRSTDGEFAATLGAGSGRAEIETASGGVRITLAR